MQMERESYVSTPVGNRVTAVLFGIKPEILNDKVRLEELLTNALNEKKFSILNTYVHQFHPQGLTLNYTLSESHLTVHVSPEKGREALTFDLYSCRCPTDALETYKSFIESLEAENEQPIRPTQNTNEPVIISESSLVDYKRAIREKDDKRIVEACQKLSPWGISTCIDLYDCNPETIRSSDAIKRFVVELCDLIDMKRFGECQVVNFGEDERVAGYSMKQLIETSMMSGHFANKSNAAYLDIFSCKQYHPFQSAEFSREFFEAKISKVQVNFRK